jgi:chemotaxis protein CheD
MSFEAASGKNSKRLHVSQGEHKSSADPEVCLTAILGSCIAICLHDPLAQVGGMNHFLLPESQDGAMGVNGRYGAYLAELLINDLMSLGAAKSRLQAKIFGGGKMFQGLLDVGAKNADFASKFLRDEGINVLGGSTGGPSARRVEFWPATGRAFQKYVDQTPILAPLPPPPIVSVGEVELF